MSATSTNGSIRETTSTAVSAQPDKEGRPVMKVFNTYKLNEDVTRQHYRERSRTVDQPLASRQPGVISYDIFEVEGAGGDGGDPFCDVVEVIEAESWEAWQAVNEQPEMKEAVDLFFAIAKRGSIQVVYGNRIDP